MEFKGTKENWKVHKNKLAIIEIGRYIVVRPESDFTEILNKNVSNEEVEANAKLIAAAPELLNALQELGKLIDDGDLVRDISNDDDSHYFTMQGLRITKAIGKYQKAINKALK